MNRLSQFQSLLLLWGSVFVTLFVSFGKKLFFLNSWSWSASGDGLKNYYTLAYYLKHDRGVHFSGMNHPFGEHLLYTDNQPILAVTLNSLQSVFGDLSAYSMGFIHGFNFLGIFLCAHFLFLIARFFKLPVFYAIVVAWIITFMSPQLMRFPVHFSLAYLFFIPMIWYFYLMIREHGKSKTTLLLFISLLVMGLIHLYYSLIGILFLSALGLVESISSKNRNAVLKWTALSISPLLLIRILIWLTDPVMDRPSAPSGFFFYHAFFGSIFLAPFGPMNELAQVFIHKVTSRFESHAYIGFFPAVLAISSLIRNLIFSIRNRSRSNWWQKDQSLLSTSVWAAVLVLLFSMALPFRLGLQFLIDWIPGLAQFRSLGRFAWVFYYVFSLFAFRQIYFWWADSGLSLRKLGTWLFFGAISIGFSESIVFMHRLSIQSKVDNLLINNPFQELDNSVKNDYSCVLSLPAVLLGSEKVFHSGAEQANLAAMQLSYETGLPLWTSMLSRTSIDQTLQRLQIFSSDRIKKPLIDSLAGSPPILILDRGEPKSIAEQKILNRSEVIPRFESFGFRKLDWEKMPNKAAWNDSSLIDVRIESSWKDTISSFRYYDPSPEREITKKARSQYVEIQFADLNIQPLDGQELEASLWIPVDPDVPALPEFRLKAYDANQVLVYEKISDAKLMYETDGKSIRVNISFYADPQIPRYEFFLKGKRDYPVHHFMITPLHGDHIFFPKGENGVRWNNYFVPFHEK